MSNDLHWKWIIESIATSLCLCFDSELQARRFATMLWNSISNTEQKRLGGLDMCKWPCIPSNDNGWKSYIGDDISAQLLNSTTITKLYRYKGAL